MLFREKAERVGIKEKLWVKGICDRLRKGAVLGARGEGRWPGTGENSPSAYEHGERMADSLQSYIKEGYLYGPFRREEMPFQIFEVSPLTIRPKPDGSVRIIVDMSYPHYKFKKAERTGINEKLWESVTG